MSVERISRFDRPRDPIVILEELDSTALVRLAGEIDLATIGHVTAALGRVDLDRITLLVLDLQDVEFLDLSGLNTIFRVREQCEADGVHFTVIGPRGSARRVFVFTRAHEQLDLVDAGAGAGR